MTPERLQEVERLYHSALSRERDQRIAFLRKECGADEALLREVELLLSYAEGSGDFLESPVFSGMGTLIADTFSESQKVHDPGPSLIGQRVAEYKVVAKIGSGGMGDVYRAVRADNEYQQLVAIKLVSIRGESGEIVSRLRAERQILAALDHPNIARLLDGGTTDDGIPFFVMELIEGEPIDQYCASRDLSVEEKLDLFLQICGAVEYAHQHLIIHRDIKPGNILVSREGVPKLLDFGVAKILTPETADPALDPTVTVARALTPAYASPEQIRGEPITTASDVFSLGVVLYELLTGLHPYRKAGMAFHDVARAVCEWEPDKPSMAVRTQRQPTVGRADASTRQGLKCRKLSQRLSGDLDTIVLAALRKEPTRRYSSVDRFANDLRRHLKRLPVEARADTFFYRTSKFIARHRMGVAASLVAAALLASAIALIVREVHIARVERARAERRFQDVRKLANSLMFEIHDSIKDLAGATPARKLLVSRALEYLDSLSQDASGDEALQKELATAYDKVGDVQGNPHNANLGDTPGALTSYRKALAIRESLLANDPSDHALQLELFRSYNLIGRALQEQGDQDGALTNLQQITRIADRNAAPHDPTECDLIAGAHWGTGIILESKGDLSGALQNYQAAAAIRKLAQNATPKQAALLHTHLAADDQGMARVLTALGQTDAALQTQKEVTSLLEEQIQADKNNATLRKFLGDSYLYTGEEFETKRDLGNALHNYVRAEGIYGDLSAADPANTWTRDWLAFARLHVGDVLVKQDKPNTALATYRKVSATLEGGANFTDPDGVAALASAYSGMGAAYEHLLNNSRPLGQEPRQNWEAARTCYQKSVGIWQSFRAHGLLTTKQRTEEADAATSGLKRCETALRSLQ